MCSKGTIILLWLHVLNEIKNAITPPVTSTLSRRTMNSIVLLCVVIGCLHVSVSKISTFIGH